MIAISEFGKRPIKNNGNASIALKLIHLSIRYNGALGSMDFTLQQAQRMEEFI